MRIVHILPALTKGGAERVAVDLANHAVLAGHDVALVVAFRVDESLLGPALDPRIRIEYVAATSSRFWRYPAMVAWLWRRRRWMLSRDVAHCHLTYGAVFGSAVQALRRLHGAKAPTVVETVHSVGMPVGTRDRWLHGRLAAMRDGLALMARETFWDRVERRRSTRPTRMIRNGVRLDQPPPAPSAVAAFRRQHGLPRGTPVVGSIGRLAAERQPWLIVDVFGAIAERNRDIRFMLGGEGPERARVERAIAAHGIGDATVMPGLITDAGVPLATLDLYVSLNVGPVTGIAALEAIAAGVPVVAKQLLPAYTGGHDDWLWSDPDPRAVGHHCAALLRDPDRLVELAARQMQELQARWSIEAMASSYYDLYAVAAAAAA